MSGHCFFGGFPFELGIPAIVDAGEAWDGWSCASGCVDDATASVNGANALVLVAEVASSMDFCASVVVAAGSEDDMSGCISIVVSAACVEIVYSSDESC